MGRSTTNTSARGGAESLLRFLKANLLQDHLRDRLDAETNDTLKRIQAEARKLAARYDEAEQDVQRALQALNEDLQVRLAAAASNADHQLAEHSARLEAAQAALREGLDALGAQRDEVATLRQEADRLRQELAGLAELVSGSWTDGSPLASQAVWRARMAFLLACFSDLPAKVSHDDLRLVCEMAELPDYPSDKPTDRAVNITLQRLAELPEAERQYLRTLCQRLAAPYRLTLRQAARRPLGIDT